ncbi:hypothetical protein [Nocardioides euryhalodurans]|uniref:Uncharacterized protein n=1 Tax=Nocardioides euryhalodurans TaxID=2518370 RepID=A0A4P7GQB8_9ACTN|nr:hypothetical protein [Nocardioides euryhalodurans]QBR94027.1 hypothetical protein EXE57_18375 [Nocardioides euryhalodurans]
MRHRPHVALGAAAGLAWAGALRGWMVLLVGADASQVSWRTPALVLLPGAAVGGLLGRAASIRASGRRPPRVLVLSPALFAVALLDPAIARSLVTDGQGSGALVVVVTAVAGGHALSCRGWPRTRIASATVAGLGVATMTGMGAMAGPLTSARGAATALLGGSLMAVLCVASALPHAAEVEPGVPDEVVTR